jgi:hypothetical protein
MEKGSVLQTAKKELPEMSHLRAMSLFSKRRTGSPFPKPNSISSGVKSGM